MKAIQNRFGHVDLTDFISRKLGGVMSINIGMNNNPMDKGALVNYIATNFNLMAYIFDWSEYNGDKEETFVGTINIGKDDAVKIAEGLCELLTQDYIAIEVNGVGHLVYNPSYKGERHEFNNEYFIKL